MPEIKHSATTATRYLRVAVDVPLYRCFDYALPSNCDMPTAGSRVQVRFGARQLTGIVIETDCQPSIAPSKIRAIDAVLDSHALFTPILYDLALRMADYYHQPLGAVCHTFLPSKLRQPKVITQTVTPHYQLTPIGHEAADQPQKSAKQTAVLHWLKSFGTMDSAISRVDCLEHIPGCGSTLNAMVKKGWLAETHVPQGGIQAQKTASAKNLNDEQQVALDAIKSASMDKKHATLLLDGITGSGKTEVYLQAIDQVLQQGQRVLVLVPEIGLTPQITQRFLSRLNARIGMLHSGRTDITRADTWLAARAGQIDVVIGTRSALFAPMENIGLLIVDEEHDAAYKQQDGIRYHARDMAILVAKLHHCPIVLGSATPSLESLANAKRGRYQQLQLTKRAGIAKPPTMQVVDMKDVSYKSALSPPLLKQMREHIDAGQQVLLFLNRRGYAPTLYCHQCSWAMECSNCSAHMVYHQKDGRMYCHHCGLQTERPKSCDNCHSEELIELGFGTQRIEQDITQHFSDVPILRIDRDSVRKKGELERLLAEIQQGEPAILVGTQMLAKGHHFPNVSLVGVLSIDHGFYSSDFRALERMGQLIVQVAGRAGRGEIPGKMLLQTHQPHNTDLQTLLKTGYATFADKLLAERESALLPPYSFHALIQLEAKTADMTETVMIEFLHAWQRVNADLDAAFLGPIPAPMPRRAGMQRYEALIQTGNRGVLRQALAQWLEEVQKINLPSQLFWALDVDPTGHY